MLRLEGKAALVTGGGSGIGRATALAFAGEGARICIADVDEAGGQETARLIREANAEAIFVRVDVTQAVQVEAMVQKAIEAWGGLDCAFNNAGIPGPVASVADCPEAEWDRVIALNLKGVWLCMKYEIPQMLRQGGGTIVNTASVAGLVGLRQSPAYVAGKHGVVGLTKAAALECARTGIRVNAVCPGYIHTPMMERFFAEDPKIQPALEARHPVGRLGTPEEVAEAVIWLCSDASSFVTGHTLVADGGWTAQ